MFHLLCCPVLKPQIKGGAVPEGLVTVNESVVQSPIAPPKTLWLTFSGMFPVSFLPCTVGAATASAAAAPKAPPMLNDYPEYQSSELN